MEFKFSKLVKNIVFRCLRAKKNKRLAAQSTTYTLRNSRARQGKQAIVKENKKYLCKRNLNL